MELMRRDYVAANNSNSRSIVVVSWIFPVLATMAVAGRFSARKMRKSYLGPDDWLILSSLVPVWGHTAIILSSVYLAGVGHHEAQLDMRNTVVLYQTLTALQFSFGTSLGLIKSSIVFLLMRIFFTRRFKQIASIVLGYCLCWMLMTILIGACMCRPFAMNWNPMLKGHCGHRIPAYTAIAALDIVGDIMILALPMPMIWNLRSSTASKIGLSFVFALGMLDIIVGILRIIYLIALNTATDYTWTATSCWIWSVLEPSLAVIVACGPTLGPLLIPLFRSLPPALHPFTTNTNKKATGASSSASGQKSYPNLTGRRGQWSKFGSEPDGAGEGDEETLRGQHGGYTMGNRSVVGRGAEIGGGRGKLGAEVDVGETEHGMPLGEIRVQKGVTVKRSPQELEFDGK